MKIFIYQDYIHNNGLLRRSLNTYCTSATICDCDSQDIANGILDEDVSLFVMPGGADLFYCEKLNGPGNQAIRRYVESGGSYLGICAGAYYACSAIEWAKDTDQNINGPRELAFYEGVATGPIYEFMDGLNTSWLGAPEIIYKDKIFKVSYAAGPAFSEPKNPEIVWVRYKNGAPAILSFTLGKGRVVLSSPHIERIAPEVEHIVYSNLNPHYGYESSVCNNLQPYADQQGQLWQDILHHLTAQTK